MSLNKPSWKRVTTRDPVAQVLRDAASRPGEVDARSQVRLISLLSWCLCALAFTGQSVMGVPLPPEVRRIVFLGDSISYSGRYAADLEAVTRRCLPERDLELLNLGLPSETVSGLSEPGHAGGSFPRPDLHERLDRVLALTKPDLVIACYGMNDGIYHPFNEERFAAFCSGINRLHRRVQNAGARIILLTPPVFDRLPIRDRTLPVGRDEYPEPFEGYDEVLDRYSGWLLEQRALGWAVIDVHGPMKEYLRSRRASDPEFILAGDGVHLNEEGHWLMAREVLRYFEAPPGICDAPAVDAALQPVSNVDELLRLIGEKQRVLTDAWLTSIGHRRPGMNPGLPLGEASERAEELEVEIRLRMRSDEVVTDRQPPVGYYRFPTLRADTVVFTAEGDLWTVSVAGGTARRLTTHPGTEAHAAISPDGEVVAFSGEYEGPKEVYSMRLNGGLPTRQTFEGGATVVGWTGNGQILYSTRALATLPNDQLVQVDSATGRQERIPLNQASDGVFSVNGSDLFFTRLPFQGSSTKTGFEAKSDLRTLEITQDDPKPKTVVSEVHGG